MRQAILVVLLVSSLVTGVNAQWKQVNTLTGGSIVTDIIEFKGHLYIAILSAGIFKSTDDGDSWERLNLPGQPNMTRLVEHNLQLLAFSYGRIFRTSDGINWSENTGIDGFIHNVASDGTSLFVAAFNGIYKSIDAGMTWAKMTDVTTHIDMKSVAVSGSKVLAGSEIENKGVIFQSENGGSTWSTLNHGSNYISAIFLKGDVILINIPYDGAYKSTDNGSSWKLIRADPQGEARLFVTATSIYFFTNYRLSVSNDDGETWSEKNSTIPFFSASELFVNDLYAFVGCWGGGIFRTEKSGSGSWQTKNSGLAVGGINDIEVVDDRIFAAMEFSFIRSSADRGVTWDQKHDAYNLPSGGSRVLMSTESALFVGAGGGGIQRSSDAGNNWERKNEGLANWNVIGFASIGEDIFAATDNGVYTSANSGDNWGRIATDITAGIRTVYSDRENLYTGTWQGLFKSENKGASSNKISGGLPDESIGYITHVGDVLFAATQFNGLHKTTDDGNTWELVNTNSVLSLTARHTDVFMGSFSGKVYISADSGDTWKDISAGLPDVIISSISFTDTHLLVGTSAGYGLWQRPLIEIFGPRIAITTGYRESRFRIGQPIYISSDQELVGVSGNLLQAAEVPDYITFTNAAGAQVSYSAQISSDGKTITLLPQNTVDGELYTLTIKPIANGAGLRSALKEIRLSAFVNTVPVVSTLSVSAIQDEVLTFSAESFSNAFSDADDDAFSKIMITSTPQHGSLKLSAVELHTNAEITVESIHQMSYTPGKGYVGSDEWKWKGADNFGYALQEATVVIIIAPVTSTTDEWTSEAIQVFPNPVASTLNVALPGSVRDNCTLTVRDLSGRVVEDVACVTPEDNFMVSLDLSSVPPGMYILNILRAGNSFNVKIIKR